MEFCGAQAHLLSAPDTGQVLPVNPLNVVVRLGCQLMAATQSATLQNFPAVAGSHAGSEPVNTDAAADFGLIGTLGHD